MVLAVHLLAGAAIVSKINSTPLALVLAFLSHFFLDALPHYEYSIKYLKERTWRYAFLDLSKIFLDIGCGILAIFLFSDNFSLALIGGMVTFLPDGLTLLYFIFPRNAALKWFFVFHCKIVHYPEKDKKMPLFQGILGQTITVFASIFLLFF